MNADQVQQCTSDPAIAIKISNSMALGQEMEVTGAPLSTWVVARSVTYPEYLTNTEGDHGIRSVERK